VSKRSVIVCGPKGCGKTTHAEQLRKHFGLTSIVDDWDGSHPYPTFDALVLTSNPDPRIAARGNYHVFNKALLERAKAVTA
jgi:tRNA A37 N6-isopentenylltransferase MiaA